jgi:hypothetical protein
VTETSLWPASLRFRCVLLRCDGIFCSLVPPQAVAERYHSTATTPHLYAIPLHPVSVDSNPEI